MSIADYEIEVDAELVDNVYDLGLEGDELLDVEVSETIGSRSGGGGGTTDYTYLSNKPKIEGVTLTGNKTLKDFGIIDLIYPVGSYYETSNGLFNPNSAWGGTWSLEEEGLVHIGAGANYTAGSTGGSKDAVLVYHNHTQDGHSHWSGLYGVVDRFGAGNRNAAGTYSGYGGAVYTSTETPSISYSGESGTNKNMQPYVVVYRWHRTA